VAPSRTRVILAGASIAVVGGSVGALDSDGKQRWTDELNNAALLSAGIPGREDMILATGLPGAAPVTSAGTSSGDSLHRQPADEVRDHVLRRRRPSGHVGPRPRAARLLLPDVVRYGDETFLLDNMSGLLLDEQLEPRATYDGDVTPVNGGVYVLAPDGELSFATSGGEHKEWTMQLPEKNLVQLEVADEPLFVLSECRVTRCA
jgi:hypothetical protein